MKQLRLPFGASGIAAPAKVKKAGPQRQLTLSFPREVAPAKFKAGEIVLRSWPWFLGPNGVVPFWQIRGLVSGVEVGRHVISEALADKNPDWSEGRVKHEVETNLDDLADQYEIDVHKWHYVSHAVPYGCYPGGDAVIDFEEGLVSTGIRWKVPTWRDLDKWCRRETPECIANHPKGHRAKTGICKADELAGCLFNPFRAEGPLVRMLRKLGNIWNQNYPVPLPQDVDPASRFDEYEQVDSIVRIYA